MNLRKFLDDEAWLNLTICNNILPRGMQHAIEKAAGYAWLGNERAAAECRVTGGYGGCGDSK